MDSLLGSFLPLTFWHWLIGALVLLGLELFAPGAVFLRLGIAAAVTALLVFLVPSVLWQIQFLVFSLFSIISILAYWKYRQRNPLPKNDHPALNRRGEQYVGRIVTLEEPLANGTGRIRLGDTMWKVFGPDLPSGARVRISGVDGAVLTVEQASSGS